MRKLPYLDIAIAMICSISLIYTSGKWVRHHAAQNASVPQQSLSDSTPPASTSPMSISGDLFKNRIPTTATRDLPPVRDPFISLRLYTPAGDRFPNQLMLKSPNRDNMSLFTSIWNYTDHPREFALSVLMDYKTIQFSVDDQKPTKRYLFKLEPNQVIEIPVSFGIQQYTEGLHDLIFLVMDGPDQHASTDIRARTNGGIIFTYGLVIGTWDGTTTWRPEDDQTTGQYSIRLREDHSGVVTVKADTPTPVNLALTTQSKSWKIVTILDSQQIDLPLKTVAGQPGEYTLSGSLPPLAPGEHEGLVLYVSSPFAPMTDNNGALLARRQTMLVRFTAVSN